MKILFSPSETKTHKTLSPPIIENSFLFPSLYSKRYHVLNLYQALLDQQDTIMLKTLFGIKDEEKCFELSQNNLFLSLTCKAIERYSGVAYEYLDYVSLGEEEKKYIDSHVIIFSNLFGPLLASDNIPHYKLHQGSTLNGFKPEAFYKEAFTEVLDEMLENEFIIDLRASFYEKFYTLKKPYITMKFLKNGKVVSHFAKAYRGKILRQLSFYAPKNEEEFKKINFSNLKIVEILNIKLKTEYVFEIVD